MSDQDTAAGSAALTFTYTLAAPPEKVWRALTHPRHLSHWLPEAALGGNDAEGNRPVTLHLIAATPGERLSYAWRDSRTPGVESIVTFAMTANGDGTTTLRIDHQAAAPRRIPAPARAANNNTAMMRAA